MYEAGWNKPVSYILAFSEYQIVDVTKRYTRKWNEVKARRRLVTEEDLMAFLVHFNFILQYKKPAELVRKIGVQLAKERAEMEQNLTAPVQLKEEEKRGRISGSEEWKTTRGEIGSIATSIYVEESNHPDKGKKYPFNFLKLICLFFRCHFGSKIPI